MPCQSIFNIGLYSQTYYLSRSPSRRFRVDNITDFLPANESNLNAKLAAGGRGGRGGEMTDILNAVSVMVSPRHRPVLTPSL